MANIKMFNIKGHVEELPSKQVTLEKELQKLLEDNMYTFFGVTFLKSEYRITDGRMDSIGIDENNCPVIFEYKRSVNENVINQGLFYLDWLLGHKADFKLLVLEVLGQKIADSIDWSMPSVICIANDFTKYDEHAVNQMQRNIKLIRYRKFGDDLIAFEHLNAPQVQPLFDNTVLQSVKNNNEKDKDFKQCFEEANEKTQNLFYTIKEYILSLGDDVSENPVKHYVVYKKAKNVICVGVNKNSLWLRLKLNPDTVDLIPGFIIDIRGKGYLGTGDLRVIIKNIDDFEKVQHLINRAYNEN